MSPARPRLAICFHKDAVIEKKLRKYRVHSPLLSMEPIASNNCNALRVSPAVTRLTVYRGLQVQIAPFTSEQLKRRNLREVAREGEVLGAVHHRVVEAEPSLVVEVGILEVEVRNEHASRIVVARQR